MKRATLTETKNQLSSMVDHVRHGETILILDRGRPVARLSSVLEDETTAAEGRLDRLERQGLLHRGDEPKTSEFLSGPCPKPRKGGSILDALLEERRTGR